MAASQTAPTSEGPALVLEEDGPPLAERVVRAGRVAWGLLGLVGVAIVVAAVALRLQLVVVPLILALFPAALLAPAAEWLKRHGVPHALAAILIILATIGLLAGVTAVLVPVVGRELPALGDSIAAAVEDVQRRLDDLPFGIDASSVQQLIGRARQQLAGASEQIASQALSAVTILIEGIAGLLFGLVALFFYLKDGDRLASALCGLLPARAQPHADELGARAWGSVSGYIRGQLLIALADAVVIGIGLLLLGVPLVLPLAVIVFVGGLFPIVGAFVSGLLAVMVALASGGLGTALAVFALVLVVQQVEGDVLAPLVFGSTVALHPLVVLIALTAGAVLLGVLGAFLAVPLAAAIARAVDYIRDGRGELGVNRASSGSGDTQRS